LLLSFLPLFVFSKDNWQRLSIYFFIQMTIHSDFDSRENLSHRDDNVLQLNRITFLVWIESIIAVLKKLENK
jgi:hypothetical protein